MSKIETNTIDTISGSATMQVGSTNTSTINIGVSGDTVNIPAGVTIANAGTATGFGITSANTPNFLARKTGSAQSLSHNTYTLITFNTEDIDTAGDYDTSTSRYTFSVAGTYWVYVSIKADSTATNDMLGVVVELRKNGTQVSALPQISDLKAGYISGTERPTQDAQASAGALRTFAVNDYIEVYCAVKTGTGGTAGRIQCGDGYNSYFGAYKLT